MFTLTKHSTRTHNNVCVSFISKNTHFIENAHTIIEKKILKRKVFCMPAMVGHIRIVNIGSVVFFILEMYLRLGLLVIHALSLGPALLTLEITFLSTIIKAQRLLMIQMSLIER